MDNAKNLKVRRGRKEIKTLRPSRSYKPLRFNVALAAQKLYFLTFVLIL